MEDKLVRRTLKAMGIPELVYKWDISDLEDGAFRSALISKLNPSILDFVTKRKHMIIEEDFDTLLAARSAVFMLAYMLTHDYTNVGYVTPAKLADMKAESWEGRETYSSYLEMDLVVLDRAYPGDLDKFKLGTMWAFIEARFLNRKSTVIVADTTFNNRTPPHVKNLIAIIDVKQIKR